MDSMSFIWEGSRVFEETVLPLRIKGPVRRRLLFPVSEILQVTSYDKKTIFEENKDFYIKDGDFVVPENTSMNIMPYSVYNFPEKPQTDPIPCKTGGYLFFTEGTYIVDRQYRITYKHDPSDFYVPEKQPDKLPRFKKKLNDGSPVTIGVFGDSIAVGCNSSKILGIEPFSEPWPVQLAIAIQKEYKSEVSLINRSQGGTTSGWGAENVKAMLGDCDIDLAIINFGMNDGAGVSVERYIENLRLIANILKKECYGCEIVFISPSQPNPLVDDAQYHRDRTPFMYFLADEFGDSVAIAPMNELHNKILLRKDYYDMTANNINHPNDFLASVYGQLVFYTITP